MKSITTGLLVFIFFITMAYGAEHTEMTDEKEKTSYAFGMNMAKEFKKQDLDIHAASFAKGFQDAFSGSKTLLSEEEMQTILIAFQQRMVQKQAEKRQAVGEKNKKEGEAFLAANQSKEGVKTTATGLQYKIIKDGTGKSPKAGDTVTTHYRGTLIDGTEFDSSYKRNAPATFPVNGVIRGWTEALQMMKPGAKWQLFIPSGLAYGERGTGQVIGPHSALIFEVELISIDSSQPKQNPQP